MQPEFESATCCGFLLPWIGRTAHAGLIRVAGGSPSPVSVILTMCCCQAVLPGIGGDDEPLSFQVRDKVLLSTRNAKLATVNSKKQLPKGDSAINGHSQGAGGDIHASTVFQKAPCFPCGTQAAIGGWRKGGGTPLARDRLRVRLRRPDALCNMCSTAPKSLSMVQHNLNPGNRLSSLYSLPGEACFSSYIPKTFSLSSSTSNSSSQHTSLAQPE